MNDLQRLMSKVDVLANGCWQMRAAVSPNGYGKFWFEGRVEQAHRASYVLHRGRIPAGCVIDHLCRNRSCVNPDHLEAVSQRENLLRGETSVSRQIRSTHCANGHPRTPENVRHRKDGSRACVRCNKEVYRRSLHPKRVAS